MLHTPLIDKFVLEWITRLSLHDVALCTFISHGNSWYHVSSQVNTQDSDGSERQRDVQQNEEQEWGDLGDVGGQCVSNGFLQVVKDQTTCEGKTSYFTLMQA